MKKILTFIMNENHQLLLLLGSANDPYYHRSFWYVVTGGVEEEDYDLMDTVKREVKEETNLDVLECLYLNWIFKYKILDMDCIEYAFMSFVSKEKIILNEESIDYKWCELDEFIDRIEWFGDKTFLRKVLNHAMHKRLFLDKEIINE